MAHILLVEDDSLLGNTLELSLTREGHAVTWAKDIYNAKGRAKEKLPDLYLLDWNLPDGESIHWVKEIRESDRDVPVLFLTARVDHDSAVKALRSGANDFIRKPFSLEELLLRIQRSLNEVIKAEDVLRFGRLWIEKNSMKAFYDQNEVRLTQNEYLILQYLIENVETPISREKLIDLVSRNEETLDRTIDAYMSRIRRALRQSNAHDIKVSSVYGVGYKIEKNS